MSSVCVCEQLLMIDSVSHLTEALQSSVRHFFVGHTMSCISSVCLCLVYLNTLDEADEPLTEYFWDIETLTTLSPMAGIAARADT